MEWPAVCALLLCGVSMGFINNLAGAGGLIGLMALDMAAGLSPGEANAALRPAALAIGTSGLIGYFSKGKPVPLRAWGYAIAAIPGAIAGALLVIALPEWVYQGALLAVVIAVLYQQLRLRGKRQHSHSPTSIGLGMLLFSLIGLHMGFLQIAVGLLIMMALSRIHSHDLIEVNAVKTVIIIATATAATAVLASAGAIRWQPALWLALGAAVGSFGASRWALAKGHGAVRIVVLLVCLALVIRLITTAFE